MKKQLRTADKVILTLIFLVGAVVLVLGVMRAVAVAAILRDPVRTEGRIVSVFWPRPSKNAPSTTVEFTTTDGRPITFTSSKAPRDESTVGNRIPVVYQGTNPGNAEIDRPGSLYGGVTILFWVGAGFIGLGVIIIILRRKLSAPVL